MEFPAIRRTERKILINPRLDQVLNWFDVCAYRCPVLSVDIETEKRQITSIAFASAPGNILVVPLWNKESPDWNFWEEREELLIWEVIYFGICSYQSQGSLKTP
jgi:hypothetical protein